MARGGQLRLFVAADVPEAARVALAVYGRGMAAREPAVLRAVEAVDLHVTLCFLGSRAAGDVTTLRELLSNTGAEVAAPSLAVRAAAWLPSARHARVLALDLEDEQGRLAALQSELAAAISSAIGWKDDRRTFRAHVTVVRVRGRRRPAAVLGEAPPLGFDVEAVSLQQSVLGGGRPARYETLARVGF